MYIVISGCGKIGRDILENLVSEGHDVTAIDTDPAIIEEVNNVALMSQEILLIDEMLDDNDVVERIYINFCNPWPKERHKKRRLTHTRQLEKYKKFLKPGGEIWFKTDDDELFEESLEYFKECNLEIKYITYDLHNSGFEGNVTTEHEDMFTAQGIKTKFLIAEYK